MKRITGWTGLLALALALFAVQASAKTVVLDVQHPLPALNGMFEQLAAEFTRQNPDITITFRASPPNYNDGYQTMLRDSLTNKLPDIYFAGYSTYVDAVRQLRKRNQVVALDKFISKEGADWKAVNFEPNIFAIGHIDGNQYGMPFNASGPVLFVNATLVRKAGGDPDHFPDTWDGVLALAHKIKEVEPDADGISYDLNNFPEDWLWQAIVKQQGGSMFLPNGKIAYDDGRTLAALKLARRFVAEGGMTLRDQQQSRQQFAAGKMGMIVLSPLNIRTYAKLIGDRFELRTEPYPIANRDKGTLPMGGNVAILMNKDAATQEAAWKFIRFGISAEGQAIAVNASGYLPVNKKVLQQGPLAEMYRSDKNWSTSAKQLSRYSMWEGYPGGRGVEIWRGQRDIVTAVMRGEVTPEQGAAQLVKMTNAMIEAK